MGAKWVSESTETSRTNHHVHSRDKEWLLKYMATPADLVNLTAAFDKVWWLTMLAKADHSQQLNMYT